MDAGGWCASFSFGLTCGRLAPPSGITIQGINVTLEIGESVIRHASVQGRVTAAGQLHLASLNLACPPLASLIPGRATSSLIYTEHTIIISRSV